MAEKNKNNSLSPYLIIIGLVLIADGVLSIFLGVNCLDMCLNNSFFGNFIRIFRAGLGVLLIILGVMKNGR